MLVKRIEGVQCCKSTRKENMFLFKLNILGIVDGQSFGSINEQSQYFYIFKYGGTIVQSRKLLL
uniref:Uncharacterized protein n=1 Tax=Oryza brachyantha TaxID=4533 RepID=J3LA52_ORYBR